MHGPSAGDRDAIHRWFGVPGWERGRCPALSPFSLSRTRGAAKDGPGLSIPSVERQVRIDLEDAGWFVYANRAAEGQSRPRPSKQGRGQPVSGGAARLCLEGQLEGEMLAAVSKLTPVINIVSRMSKSSLRW